MANVREVEVTLGLSVDKKGLWVKGSTKLTVSVFPEDDVKSCFERAFTLAEDALTEKMEDYLSEEEPK